jgi:hypothetical protein
MRLLTLAAFSIVAGLLILWIFKLSSNQRALKTTRRRVLSHLLAMRLFADDPVVILRSQLRLLAWNARYMALLLPAFLLIAIPLYFAWDHLDAIWGRAAFAPGDAVVVTAALRAPSPAQLVAPSWLAVETPPVRAGREVSWRVRVLRAGAGALSVHAGPARAELAVEARPGLRYLAERAAPSAGPIESVEVRYPRADLALFGLSASWVVWFCLISTLAALLLRGRLRVTM